MGFRYDFAIVVIKLFTVTAIIAYCFALSAEAQTVTQIIKELDTLNSKVTNSPCSTGKGMLISNKAMNSFLANKLSSYFSDESDVSLFKDYINMNAAEGNIAIGHNFRQPANGDELVKSFDIVAASANIANAYAARFSNKYNDNRLGFIVQHTLMGKPVTSFNQCGSQKMNMDAQRAQLLRDLEAGIRHKAADFEHSLDSVKATDVPGQSLDAARNKLRKDFYIALRTESIEKFSQAQSTLLINTNEFTQVTDNWTSIIVYVPVIAQKYEVSSDLGSGPEHHYNYPFNLSVVHTRFLESNKIGRIFFTLSAKAFINNSAQSGNLFRADVMGPPGADGVNTVALDYGDRFIGSYQNFITPVASAKIVFFPVESHIGLSFRIEKNFGTYHAINSIIGMPITMIDKNAVPVMTFEAQLLFSDWNNSIKNNQLPYNRTAVGLTIGIPIGSIVN